jgi:uncharacterized protein YjbI with pentapeptide repeats
MPTWLKDFWHNQRLWALLVIALLVVAVSVVLFWPVTDLIAAHDVGQVTGLLRAEHLQTARDAARGRLLQLGAGLFAAAALVYTARNFTLSRTGQVTDRYTKAIEQLGSDKLDVRIGAIYALERVARDSARDHPVVIDVLAAFVREHSRDPWPRMGDDFASEFMIRPDVQAAVTVAGRRDQVKDRGIVDFKRADLTGVDLSQARLACAWLHGVNLTGADLTGANLSGAILQEADLSSGILTDADLTDVTLYLAQLPRADLTQVRAFSARRLDNAYLRNANLSGMDLSGASMTTVDLTEANLSGANLTGANLSNADLPRADLTGANLAGANLESANYSGANLAGADLTGVLLSRSYKPPEGWVRDSDSGRLKRANGDAIADDPGGDQAGDDSPA